MKQSISALLAAVLCLSMLAGCAGNSSAPAADSSAPSTAQSTGESASAPATDGYPTEEVEIRMMTAWTAGSAAYEQMEKFLKTYKEQHPNVTIIHDALPSGDLRTKLTAEGAADNLADISWCVTSYAREFIRDKKIIDWKPIYEDPANPEFKEWFSDVSLNFASNEEGKIMLVPQEASIDGFYYNKELFEANGWKAPETFDELLALVPLMREKNIVPMVTGAKDGRFAWMASALLARATSLEKFNALCIGDAMTKWDDPEYGFVAAMEKFKQLVDAGAFPKDLMGLSAADADQMFAVGDAAMYYEGAWKVGNFQSVGGEEFINKLGRINFPVMSDRPEGDKTVNVGGNIIGFFVKEGLEPVKKQVAIDIIKNIVSPEFNVPIMEAGGFVYAGDAPYDTAKVSPLMNAEIEAYRTATGYIPSMDGIAPPPVDLAIKKTAMPGIVTGEFDVTKAVAEVQKAAMDYVAGLN